MIALLAVVVLGVGIVAGLAVVVGGLDAAARRTAWRAIAMQRRMLAQQRNRCTPSGAS